MAGPTGSSSPLKASTKGLSSLLLGSNWDGLGLLESAMQAKLGGVIRKKIASILKAR